MPGQRNPRRRRRRTALAAAALVLAGTLVGLGIGIATPAHVDVVGSDTLVHLEPGQPVDSVTVDNGLLGGRRSTSRTLLGEPVGVHVDFRPDLTTLIAPDGAVNTDLLPAYAQAFSDPNQLASDVRRAVLAHLLRWAVGGAGVALLALGTWWGARLWRRRYDATHPHAAGHRAAALSYRAPERRLAAGAAVTVSLLVVVAAVPSGRFTDPAAPGIVGDPVLAGTPLAGTQISGLLKPAVLAVQNFIQTYVQQTNRYYSSLQDRLETRLAAGDITLPGATGTGTETGTMFPSATGAAASVSPFGSAGGPPPGSPPGSPPAVATAAPPDGAPTAALTGGAGPDSSGTDSSGTGSSGTGSSGTDSSGPGMGSGDLVTFGLVSDRHCNIGMDRVIVTLLRHFHVSVLVSAGDDAFSGSFGFESACTRTLADKTRAAHISDVFVGGNHDSPTTLGAELQQGIEVLGADYSGAVVTAGGLRFTGAPDPRTSRYGQGIRPSSLAAQRRVVDAQGVAVGRAACRASGPLIAVLHDPLAGERALENGCGHVVLALDGHTHVQDGPFPVPLPNGATGEELTSGTTGGAPGAHAPGENFAARLTVGPLQHPAVINLVTVDRASARLVGITEFRFDPDGTITVQQTPAG